MVLNIEACSEHHYQAQIAQFLDCLKFFLTKVAMATALKP
jgi:hypothetical protein